jgi:glycosyltransferase involved in cell wall biosynthesis
VNLERFTPPSAFSRIQSPGRLRLLFVGTINQRKGVKYLLEALRLVRHQGVELTICGRVVDDLSLFKPFASQVHIRPSVTFAELVEAYQQADLFVFPSVVEGFGQVLLEALACGLPILSTTHTAAPDLIEEGIQGFVVEPRRPDLLAQRIEWALQHPTQLAEMRVAARERAQQLTCARFRAGVVAAVAGFLARREQREEVVGQYV